MQFSYQTGETKELSLEMQVLLFKHRPAIVHSYSDGKKWRSLVMTLSREILAE